MHTDDGLVESSVVRSSACPDEHCCPPLTHPQGLMCHTMCWKHSQTASLACRG